MTSLQRSLQTADESLCALGAQGCVVLSMLNPLHRHAFAPDGDLLIPYNGPRPCLLRDHLLFELQKAMRAEARTLYAGKALATVDEVTEVDHLLATFEKHLHRCADCGRYTVDPCIAD